jgi:hypothetical protein
VIALSLPKKSIAAVAFRDEYKIAATNVGRLEVSTIGLARVPGHDCAHQGTATRFINRFVCVNN